MVKKPVSLYLEADLIEELKRRNVNISELVNDFLQAYLAGGRRSREIQDRIAQLQQELYRAMREEYLEWKLSEHIDYYKRMEAKKWNGRPELKQQFLQDTALRFGLTPGEVEAICQGARPIKSNPT
jgi:uncharacterized protein (DUF4415 family)